MIQSLRNTRRRVLLGGGAAASAAMLSACGATPAAETPKALSTAPVTISFFKRGTLNEQATETLMKDWNAQHPTWRVEIVQGINDEKLATTLAAGDKIDTFTYNYAARTMILAFNMLRPIDS